MTSRTASLLDRLYDEARNRRWDIGNDLLLASPGADHQRIGSRSIWSPELRLKAKTPCGPLGRCPKHGAPILKKPGRGKACRAAPPDRLALRERPRARPPAFYADWGAFARRDLARGIRVKRMRADLTRKSSSPVIVFAKNVSKAERPLSIAEKGTLPGLPAMFEGGLKLLSSPTQPTGRTLRTARNESGA
jgi:hypothetical protein